MSARDLRRGRGGYLFPSPFLFSLRVDDTVPLLEKEEERERKGDERWLRRRWLRRVWGTLEEGKRRRGGEKGMELEREKGEKREGGYSSAMGFERRGERDVLDSTLSLNHEKTSRSPKAKGWVRGNEDPRRGSLVASRSSPSPLRFPVAGKGRVRERFRNNFAIGGPAWFIWNHWNRYPN